mmetsp:Transcript_5989/g.19761  ORF Transcript_5989/g.19761 Transcript_5989/m.19761 type:complete len:298 (-) Transcript_5989:493-1386(-)
MSGPHGGGGGSSASADGEPRTCTASAITCATPSSALLLHRASRSAGVAPPGRRERSARSEYAAALCWRSRPSSTCTDRRCDSCSASAGVPAPPAPAMALLLSPFPPSPSPQSPPEQCVLAHTTLGSATGGVAVLSPTRCSPDSSSGIVRNTRGVSSGPSDGLVSTPPAALLRSPPPAPLAPRRSSRAGPEEGVAVTPSGGRGAPSESAELRPEPSAEPGALRRRGCEETPASPRGSSACHAPRAKTGSEAEATCTATEAMADTTGGGGGEALAAPPADARVVCVSFDTALAALGCPP